MSQRFKIDLLLKFCITMAYFLSKQLNHTHAYVDNLTQVDPRFALNDENSSSRVNQTELNWGWVEPRLNLG